MAKLNEKFSPNKMTLTPTATTGSEAPKIDVAVEPISLMAQINAMLEITVVTNANVKKLYAKSIEGRVNDSFLNHNFMP